MDTQDKPVESKCIDYLLKQHKNIYILTHLAHKFTISGGWLELGGELSVPEGEIADMKKIPSREALAKECLSRMEDGFIFCETYFGQTKDAMWYNIILDVYSKEFIPAYMYDFVATQNSRWINLMLSAHSRLRECGWTCHAIQQRIRKWQTTIHVIDSISILCYLTAHTNVPAKTTRNSVSFLEKNPHYMFIRIQDTTFVLFTRNLLFWALSVYLSGLKIAPFLDDLFSEHPLWFPPTPE